MTEKLFREVMELSEKKRKNEEAVPRELLETKYKKSYEILCGRLKEAQCELRVRYTESIRELSALVSETVYMDFSQPKGLERLIEQCDDVYARCYDPFTKNLLIAVQKFVANAVEACGEKEETDGAGG